MVRGGGPTSETSAQSVCGYCGHFCRFQPREWDYSPKIKSDIDAVSLEKALIRCKHCHTVPAGGTNSSKQTDLLFRESD